jgi:predicted alpha/beta-hydrolase family hydrolase
MILPFPGRSTDNRRAMDDAYLWDPAEDAAALCVVAHGAGADMRHPFLTGVAAGLTSNGVSSLRFNFPYTLAGRRAPDRPPVLLRAWREALDEAGRRGDGLPLVASGKSLGGRMASMLAAEEGPGFAARALVFFGYPLHAPGKPENPRTAHLSDVEVPMLFIQGTSDALATFSLVEGVVRSLGARARLHAIEGGDHSFRVRRRKRPDDEIGRDLGAIAAAFVHEVVT